MNSAKAIAAIGSAFAEAIVVAQGGPHERESPAIRDALTKPRSYQEYHESKTPDPTFEEHWIGIAKWE